MGQHLGPGLASTLRGALYTPKAGSSFWALGRTCGRAQAAPENYLADAQDLIKAFDGARSLAKRSSKDSQAIIMDSREGPAFVDYAGMDLSGPFLRRCGFAFVDARRTWSLASIRVK